MNKQTQAEAIIRSHVLWAMGGGLIPIPLVDFAAVTAIQLVKRLSPPSQVQPLQVWEQVFSKQSLVSARSLVELQWRSPLEPRPMPLVRLLSIISLMADR